MKPLDPSSLRRSPLLGLSVRQACACCGATYSRALTRDEWTALLAAARRGLPVPAEVTDMLQAAGGAR